MFWSRIDLKERAKDRVRNNYACCILVSLIFAVVSGIGMTYNLSRTRLDFELLDVFAINASLFLLLLTIFVTSALEVGLCRFYVENQDYGASVSKLFFGFQCGYYGNVIKILFFRKLKTFLWSLLFLIPGIVKYYEYRMVAYIVAEQPDIDSETAFKISRDMMTGQKMNAFVLDLSFILWYIASLFTCGLLAVLWVRPYMDASRAELYVLLRNDWLDRYGGGEM